MPQFTTNTVLFLGAAALGILFGCLDFAHAQGTGPAPGNPPLPEVNTGLNEINTDAAVVLNGTIDSVAWVNPQAIIKVRDTATGELVEVHTGTPNTLMRLGGDRQAMPPGAPITVRGYMGKDGVRMFANPVAMTSNGRALLPLAEQQAAEAARRTEICGVMSAPPQGADFPAAVSAWQADCNAKLAAAATNAAGPSGPVIFSFTTNSVKREDQ